MDSGVPVRFAAAAVARAMRKVCFMLGYCSVPIRLGLRLGSRLAVGRVAQLLGYSVILRKLRGHGQ